MAIHLTPEANPTVQEGTLYVDSATGEFNVAGRTTPHIIPGVLYPSYVASGTANKLLDGTTDHSGAFGTAQSDGRKYYYTNIAGSKPIKDPRIGGHFGSQRHQLDSLQLLEQETATHGSNVYSVDGREWIRTVGGVTTTNDENGLRILLNSQTDFVEIVGYFSDLNYGVYTDGANRTIKYSLDGGGESSDYGATTAGTPLGGRYIDTSSSINLGLGATLGIHTIKLRRTGTSINNLYNIELIAQDTASTANRSKIQIPSQNVVSYGKKFTVSGTPHYDPFTTMSYGGSGTTLSALQSLIDTDTSLGMDAWKAGTSNYHRPWNGGRVIKWVDSSGAIKTSVNMMPPNAQNIGTTASNAVSDAHVIAGTNDDTINFNTSAIDNTQSEVAKPFHFREFGNGSANGGTGATYADASMLTTTTDNIAYVMDDGLTSLSAQAVQDQSSYGAMLPQTSDVYNYFTFIGTGIAVNNKSTTLGTIPFNQIAQNLPYGTHIFGISRNGSQTHSSLKIDGVVVDTDFNSGAYGSLTEVSFNQPKKPPIPEDACVIADYMLMADFVPQSSAGPQYISKGTRRQAISRDVFFDETDGDSFAFAITPEYASGFELKLSAAADSDTSMKMRIPSFGTNYVHRGYQSDTRSKLFIGDTDNDSNATRDNTAVYDSYAYLTSSLTLGVYNFGSNAASGQDGNMSAFDIVTPIHTSHHYQTFETPFLHELVGGDRNMEQHNLVCSPDGKTWDQLTRDTSYLGNAVVSTNYETDVSGSTVLSPDDWRGNRVTGPTEQVFFNKDFAIGYDRMICLVDGQYEISASTISYTGGTGGDHAIIKVNGSIVTLGTSTTSGYSSINNTYKMHLVRGDYVQIFGKWHGGSNGQYNHIQITRL